jgi:hypothetical protein
VVSGKARIYRIVDGYKNPFRFRWLSILTPPTAPEQGGWEGVAEGSNGSGCLFFYVFITKKRSASFAFLGIAEKKPFPL